MILKPTVLVLGAGASAPYGFPCGRKLLLDICKALSSPSSSLSKKLIEYGFHWQDIVEFQKGLDLSNQPSVDAFLEKRPQFVEVGKAAIVCSLIPYEQPQKFHGRGEMNWYEYLFGQIDAKLDKLSIITFNYDRSLEYFLSLSLKHTYDINGEQTSVLLKSIQIVHVYGQLSKLTISTSDGRPYSPDLDKEVFHNSATAIKILHEDKETSSEFERARKLISKADILCFLGFGYHPTNVRRLRIENFFQGKKILGSAYKLSIDERRRIQESFRVGIKMGISGEDVLDFLRNYPVFD